MSVWDRAAITLLGAAGFAFSYDALRQVAITIHARESLSYLFPVFIDGFIAYGVRALVLLRHSGFGARLYAWVLFLAATGSSLWANALHAIMLNRGPQAGQSPLYLGDRAVGVLSMLAPLALAGSVHLYIIMARTAESSVPDRPKSRPGPVRNAVQTEQTSAHAMHSKPGDGTRIASQGLVPVLGPSAPDNRDQAPADGRQNSEDKAGQAGAALAGDAENSPSPGGGHVKRAPDGQHAEADLEGEIRRHGAPLPTNPTGGGSLASEVPDSPVDGKEVSVPDGEEASADREAVNAWMEELLPIARDASLRAGRVSRDAIKEAVRAHQPISNDRLGELVAVLRGAEERAEKGAPSSAAGSLW
ncbi:MULTISPECIES: DUF2637 domain-containing protein [Streptomyces]|uniref:DUF2637 domain-containing protein n=1 Tax=Streptomyces TaxID=1883 RepID=UPI001FD5BA45|nr:DUF2637 domain-containing protein [Streptomyces kasugaensis]